MSTPPMLSCGAWLTLPLLLYCNDILIAVHAEFGAGVASMQRQQRTVAS